MQKIIVNSQKGLSQSKCVMGNWPSLDKAEYKINQIPKNDSLCQFQVEWKTWGVYHHQAVTSVKMNTDLAKQLPWLYSSYSVIYAIELSQQQAT